MHFVGITYTDPPYGYSHTLSLSLTRTRAC